MKFTHSWLKDHLETNASLEEISKTLTAIGLEVESIEDRAATFAPFKVAHVVSAEKHPDADKLKVCIVDTGSEKLQVVCGAPNARTGMKGVFAPVGSYIPGTDLLLKKGSIRGQDSNGMLVSMREMGLSDEHDGIIDLPPDTPIGTPLAQIFGLDDAIIDINVTPNRADCAGIRGIARDLAAAGLGTLKPLKTETTKGNFKNPVSVSLKDTHACPLFVACTIRNVKNGPSPDWMQNRLKSIGLRPISALVDITNYMSFDLCRPLHVFDTDKLKGGIHVRLSNAGETIEALDNKTYTLDDGMTVVCDDSGVIGLGGVMGGLSTGCTEETKTVTIECAYFDPLRTARTGRALGIHSDARYRFERGVDPQFTLDAIHIAVQMVLELCGGEASDITIAGQIPDWKREIEFNPSFTTKLGGIEIDGKKQLDILQALGFVVIGKNVIPPSWRSDIEGKADLVEEILRIHGFDHISAHPLRSEYSIPVSAETLKQTRSRLARTVLAARGLHECVTWSFMAKGRAGQFGTNDNSLILANPISADMDYMRPCILPNLIDAASRNADKGYENTSLFEVGPVFGSVKPDGQSLVAAGIRFGSKANKHWTGAEASRDQDVMDAKADVIAVLETIGFSASSAQVRRGAAPYYHPGRSGTLSIGNTVIAQFGDLHPALLDDMKIDSPVVGFEVFLDGIPQPKKKGTAKPNLQLSPFQPVTRDFAFIVDQNVEADSLLRAAKGADKAMISDADIFDIYIGKGVEDGKKSIAIAVTIQPRDHTLTDAEIEGLSQKIIAAVTAKTGGTLRS